MPTILVIHPNPASILRIRCIVPADWLVLEANDGLRGLELARRHRAELDLIVFHPDLPLFDGLLVCALLRAALPKIPMQPIGERIEVDPTLADFACLPPITETMTNADLAAQLHYAITQVAELRETPTLRLLQLQAAQIERQLREQHRPVYIAVFANSTATRTGLKHLAAAACPGASVVSVADLAQLAPMITTHHTQVVIAGVSEYNGARAVTQALDLPLIIVTKRLDQVKEALDDGVTSIILEDEVNPLLQQLRVVIDAAAGGKRLVPPSDADSSWPYIPHRPLPGLSKRETELVLLDLNGWSTKDIAARFKVAVPSVATYWRRVYSKRNGNREQVRQWAVQEVQRVREAMRRGHGHNDNG